MIHLVALFARLHLLVQSVVGSLLIVDVSSSVCLIFYS